MMDVMPPSLGRRIILSLLGYHCRDGRWVGPGPDLSEEQVDRMSATQWTRYVARWVTSATATN
jgi:hypothetical protein